VYDYYISFKSLRPQIQLAGQLKRTISIGQQFIVVTQFVWQSS